MLTPVSSNHFGLADQVQDSLNWLANWIPQAYSNIRGLFPDVFDMWDEHPSNDLRTVLDQPQFDIETVSWLVDAIEDESPIGWRDGEPFVCEVYMHGGISYVIGRTEFFRSVVEACDTWIARLDSSARPFGGVLCPWWGDGMSMDDAAISDEHGRHLTVAHVVTIATYPHRFESPLEC